MYLTDNIKQQIQDNIKEAETQRKRVEILWIPFHTGILGEKTDQAAKQTTKKQKQKATIHTTTQNN